MESKYTALIIEPRKHTALEFVLDNFLENLNNDWNIIIYHGTNNKEYLQNIINTKLEKYKNRITTRNLNVANLSIDNYNTILTNKEFINSIPTEIFLIFQTDTMICEQHKDLINNFLNYDYVGAPWVRDYLYDNNIDIKKLSSSSAKYVGNGGLSLRRKSKIIEIIEKCKYLNVNEDIYFSHGCNGVDINKPLIDDAKNFSIETVYNNKSFGVHKAWNYVKLSDSQCKNYNELVKLNTLQEQFDDQVKKDNINTKKGIIINIVIIIIVIIFIVKLYSINYNK
jgi:hypothetical protein